MFEIEGISKDSIDTYSRRAKQIETYMKEYGYSGAKAAAVATLKTRQAKQNISRETVETLWKNMSESKGIDAFGEAKKCVVRSLENLDNQKNGKHEKSNEVIHEASQKAVQYAISYLSETRIILKEMDILNIALRYAVGENINIKTILKSIEDFKIKGELIPLENPEKAENKNQYFYNETGFTTKVQIEHEREILSLIHAKTRNSNPLISAQKIEAYLSAPSTTEISSEQKQAMRVLFSNNNKIGILDGSTGTGKTYLIKPMMELAKAGGYQTVLLTPSKAQNEDLKASFGKNSKKPDNLLEWFKSLFAQDKYATVSGFLNHPDKYIDASPLIKRKAIAFIDNAHLISRKQWNDLSILAKKTHLHLIALGDKKSLQTFQAGTPYTQMLEQGGVSATLTQNYRTQDKKIKEALSDSLNSNIGKAFEKIKDQIFSTENKEERLNMMATRFAVLSQKERDNTLLLMPSKAQCEEISEIVRDALKKNNAIQQNGIFTQALIPKSLAESEYDYAKNYEKKQWIRFNEDYRSLKVKRGDYLQVISIMSKQNTVLLENQKGQTIAWNPLKTAGRAGSVEVFDANTRELVVGETLNWRRNDKDLGFHNGERLRIIRIQGNQISVKRDNEKVQTISLDSITARHFDYGYAFTAYQRSHVKAENVIAYQASFSRQSHQRLFYKTLGQAEKNVWIYTENKEGLLKNLQRQTGNKITAIEALLGKEYTSETSKISEVSLLEKAVTEALLKIQGSVKENHKEKNNTPEGVARNAVQYAIQHLAEREAAFEHKKVMEVALKYALGNAGLETIQQCVIDAEKNGDIIKGIYSQDGTRWTTQEAIEMEREIIKLARADKTLTRIASEEKVENHLKNINPKAEHVYAIQEMTKHTGSVLNIQGYAGVGKTTLLKYIEPLLKEEKFELLCLAPTHSAVKELSVRGLTAQTVESFLGQHRATREEKQAMNKPADAKESPKLIIAVDESSMVSNRRMRDFLRIADNLEARSWIMGDKKQHPAIESGKPATILERAGVKTLYLTDIERQKNPTLLKAIKETYQGDFAKAFETLEKNMIEIGKEVIKKSPHSLENKKTVSGEKSIDNREKRLTAIRDAYIQLDPKERAQTLIVTFGNEDRLIANQLIREGLSKNGELTGKEIKTSILVSQNMTAVEKSRTDNYAIGDKIRFRASDKILGIEKNDYLIVSQINVEDNLLTLSNPNNEKNEKIMFQPKSHRYSIEVYKSEERKLQAGDYIRWTRSDKETGFLSPDVLRVEQIEKIEDKKETKLHLQPVKVTPEGWSLDGAPISIDAQNKLNQHWDYAYVMTGYSAQGRTVKNVIVNAESYRKNLTNEASFLVGITRVVQNLTLYTDDKDNLLKKIQENSKEKTSALETIGELQKIKKSDQRESQHKQEKQREQPSVNIASEKSAASHVTHKTKSLDAASITRALHENAQSVVEKIMGEPKERTNQQYRYGTKQGSLIVTIKGEKQGLWHDFQTGEGGNLLHLVAKQSGLDIKTDFQKVLEEGVKIIGTPESFMKENYHKETKKEPAKNTVVKLTETQQRSLKYAQKLAQESKPVKGTLAEKYLREHRGIDLDKFPDAIRFHPAVYSRKNEGIHPALIAVAKDEQGKVKAIQAIYLDAHTAQKAKVNIQKQTWGLPSSGVTVNLGENAQKEAPVFIAEGPETGLSLYAALGKANVKVTLGKSNFKNIDTAMPQKNIVLCLDNDGNPQEEKKNVKELTEKFSDQDKNIWVIKPEIVGKDYNDILKEEGRAAIQKNIENAILHKDFINENINAPTLKSEVLNQLTHLRTMAEINKIDMSSFL